MYKELDYQIRCTGILSKPPCGAVVNAMVLSDKVKALKPFVWLLAVWYGYRS
jgi:hypothetical protein